MNTKQLSAIVGDLTAKELRNLITAAEKELLVKEDVEWADKRKELTASGKLKELKAEWNALKKEGKQLSKKYIFDLPITLRFTLHTTFIDGPPTNIYWNELDEMDLWDHIVDTTILNPNEMQFLVTTKNGHGICITTAPITK